MRINNLKQEEQNTIPNISKRDLGNYLADIIAKCVDDMQMSEHLSKEWMYAAGKKQTAETILIKFC